MSVLAGIILGALSGFIGSRLANKSGEARLLNIALGVVGALVGIWLFQKFGMAGTPGVNFYSILVALAGATGAILVYHAIFQGRVWRVPGSLAFIPDH